MFGFGKLKELEKRIAALEDRGTSTEYATATSTSEETPFDALKSRVKRLEDTVGDERYGYHSLFRTIYFGEQEESLTLVEKVRRICDHLKIRFVTEPKKTVIKPVGKKAKA